MTPKDFLATYDSRTKHDRFDRSHVTLLTMKNPAAVALGRKRAAKHKEQIGKKGLSEYMRDLALKRHRSIDKTVMATRNV